MAISFLKKQHTSLRRSFLVFLRKTFFILVLLFFCADYGLAGSVTEAQWAEQMAAFRTEYEKLEGKETKHKKLDDFWREMERRHPVEWDWFLQDFGEDGPGRWLERGTSADFEADVVRHLLEDIEITKEVQSDIKERFSPLVQEQGEKACARRLEVYVELCRIRREQRLETLIKRYPKIVFTKHYNLGGSHYAYTEGQSDAQGERHFVPGSWLCLLTFEGAEPKIQTLLSDREGVIRDPDVSYDGKKILFSWKKSDRQDDYHLYEMDVETKQIRALTEGLGFADYEGAYLPNGDIVFNSTRCVQTVDCWWTEVSNLYTCDADGGYLRRLTFDQVHTNFPTILPDGRVIYTRWDYNDRGQLFPQGLFQMNPDGTGQTEFYGNNSWFPTTILHARGIPESQKLVAIATGHHSLQKGKLILIDSSKGRQEAEGVQLIAPVQKTEAVRIDVYGQDGEQFQYPYPISEESFIVSYYPRACAGKSYQFKIYFMTIAGERELIASDHRISCNQPVPLAAREGLHLRPSIVDYHQDTGVYYLQDIYVGPGLKGIARGAVKSLRVVGLDYRAAGIGKNENMGPGGGALISTPVSIDNGSWDVKRLLGSASVYADGSACFTVPARTPLYFQAVDENGCVIQTMRSWSTLQPGESFSCVGCHESKDTTPIDKGTITTAMKAGPETLKPFYGPARGFSFPKEIQPILDKHCISCHDDRSKFPNFAKKKSHSKSGRAKKKSGNEKVSTFSLRGEATVDETARRIWSDSYLALTQKGKPNRIVQWLNVQSIPTMLEPYFAGAARSELMSMVQSGHHGVSLSKEEKEKIACWIDLLVPYCGDYTEANTWSAEEKEKYQYFLDKRKKMEEIERRNIAELLSKE
jgi:hypothetical protein